MEGFPPLRLASSGQLRGEGIIEHFGIFQAAQNHHRAQDWFPKSCGVIFTAGGGGAAFKRPGSLPMALGIRL